MFMEQLVGLFVCKNDIPLFFFPFFFCFFFLRKEKHGILLFLNPSIPEMSCRLHPLFLVIISYVKGLSFIRPRAISTVQAKIKARIASHQW